MHNDCHVHSRGDEKASDILRAMDECLATAGRFRWGSDAGATTVGSYGKEFYDRERVILGELLGRPEEEMEQIGSENLRELMKPFD